MIIRVVVFDDNQKRRDSLKTLIDLMGNMKCVAVYEDCRDVLQHVTESKPDVVLMDIDMPFVNGIEGVQLIRTRYPNMKILMQTVFEDDDKIFASICAGANGYILKEVNPTRLIEAISEVYEEGAPMTPAVARKVLQLFSKMNRPAAVEAGKNFDLSKRELDILEFLVKGYSYKMIADECHISYPTVNTHVSNIYRKLQVQSVAGAVSIALREGLVR